MTEYTYAVATDPDSAWLIRQAKGAKSWEILASIDDADTASQLAEDANLAQRVRPQLEKGQELSRKPQRKPRKRPTRKA